jgi:hypothetical protein
VAEHVRADLVQPRMRSRLLPEIALDQWRDLLADENAEQADEGDHRGRCKRVTAKSLSSTEAFVQLSTLACRAALLRRASEYSAFA